MTIATVEEYIQQYSSLTDIELVEGWNRLIRNHPTCVAYRRDGLSYESIADALWEDETLSAFIENEIEEVEFEGGEGEGEYAHEVLRFKSRNVYMKLTGNYYSYDGFSWHSAYELVKPHQVSVTKYY